MDLMGGKASEVAIPTTALPTRPYYWIILLAQWDPAVTGDPGA